MLVMMYGQVRVSYAMSRDGLLPKRLAKVHPKFKTPFLNTWTTGIIAALISGLIDLNVLAHLVNMGTLSAFALVAVAVIVMRRTHPDLPRAFKAPLVPFLPALTVIFCLYLMLQLSGTAWISFGIWMVIGIAVYFLYSRKHSALNNSKKMKMLQIYKRKNPF